MSECESSNKLAEPQCQFFVVRKKRLCRMTVRPGRNYCGEHEPQPKADDGQCDTRVPCPNDPKHTCYASKLEKHLAICNARQGEVPPYIIHNINAPEVIEPYPRKLLSEISRDTLLQVIDKVNKLYEKHIKYNITTELEHPIHTTVLEEFQQASRTETSRRHLRQASSLLWLIEEEGLVRNGTCYVELGAGKGQLSYYAYRSWCSSSDSSASSDSSVVVVDRAALRHKRDNKLPRGGVWRLRADLRHLALHRLPPASRCATAHVLGLAKHLCGVATDYALRCITAPGVVHKTCGVVVATCCHHRCEHADYVANKHLQELGINAEDLNVMLGIVSWATCGDGRSRDKRNQDENNEHINKENTYSETTSDRHESGSEDHNESSSKDQNEKCQVFSQAYREEVGRRAKHLLDWGRVLYLREKGFHARLSYYVPTSVSLENVCIVAKK